jgi:hypothetical protein
VEDNSGPNRLKRCGVMAHRRGIMAQSVTALAVLAALSNHALANTGKVDFTIGNVILVNSDGRTQPVKKGTDVASGDKITSGTDGRVQIRFSDGGYVSLQPGSEFEVKEYRFSGKADGSESAIFGLFKGAMRTVTGLVGRVNRNKYQVSTPTATIGIRGTGGIIRIGADGSTLVTGTSGIWTLSNHGGMLEIPAGSSGFAANPNVPPKQTNGGPVIPPTQPQTQPANFVAGDVRTATGAQAAVATLQSGSGFVAVLSEGLSVTDHGVASPNPATAVFNSAGQMTEISYLQGGSPFDFVMAGKQTDFGTVDGVIAWGRWIGDVSRNGSTVGTFSDNQGFHYVIGLPTPFASLPTSGTFTYNLIGATSPTFADGLSAPGTVTSAMLTGDFLNKTVSVQLNATAAGMQFNGVASGMSITNVNGSAVFGNTAASGTGSGCPNVCQLNLTGFFAGNAASHAGISYDFSNTAQGSSLVGAAAFKR